MITVPGLHSLASSLLLKQRGVSKMSKLYECPNCETELKLVPQCGDMYSCAKCKEFFIGEYLLKDLKEQT